MKADREKTEAAGFADKRSYICWDGREVLYGKDWEARKRELWQKCGGRCEERIESIRERCKGQAHHPHHLIKKSIKRDDRLQNLMGICETHHRLRHPEKQTRFGEGRGESAESQK